MIFSIQHHLEDYFEHRNLKDVDQYAVKLANLYAKKRHNAKDEVILKSMRRIQTVFYRNNSELDRTVFESGILHSLDQRFKKKLESSDPSFPGEVTRERAALKRLPRLSVRKILDLFKRGVEARAVDTLWKSRAKGQLRPKPEKLGQGLLAQFILGALSNTKGHLLREVASGVGFVDVAIILARVLHLIELKVLQRGSFTGAAQLTQYMQTEQRRCGWLVVFDARRHERQVPLPQKINTAQGIVWILVININPVAPSRLNG